MRSCNILVSVPDEGVGLVRESIRELYDTYDYFSFLNIRVLTRKCNNYDEYFYAENETVWLNGHEAFKINLSSITLQDMRLLKSVLDAELHKAFLYFTNKALKTLRWKAGEIVSKNLSDVVKVDTYVKLVDTVENCLITLFNPKLSQLFIDLYLDIELYEDQRDFILSQVMTAPVYSIGKIVPHETPDEIESLTILLTTYANDLLEKPYKETGVNIARELHSVSEILVNAYM